MCVGGLFVCLYATTHTNPDEIKHQTLYAYFEILSHTHIPSHSGSYAYFIQLLKITDLHSTACMCSKQCTKHNIVCGRHMTLNHLDVSVGGVWLARLLQFLICAHTHIIVCESVRVRVCVLQSLIEIWPIKICFLAYA